MNSQMAAFFYVPGNFAACHKKLVSERPHLAGNSQTSKRCTCNAISARGKDLSNKTLKPIAPKRRSGLASALAFYG
jgi:hypothetical protein